jgi:hypothetical protein
MNKQINQNSFKNLSQLLIHMLIITTSGSLYHLTNKKLFKAYLNKKSKQLRSLKFKKVEI